MLCSFATNENVSIQSTSTGVGRDASMNNIESVTQHEQTNSSNESCGECA